jgi:hypothetical protein
MTPTAAATATAAAAIATEATEPAAAAAAATRRRRRRLATCLAWWMTSQRGTMPSFAGTPAILTARHSPGDDDASQQLRGGVARRWRRLGHVLGLVDDLATGDDAELRNPHGPPLARRR